MGRITVYVFIGFISGLVIGLALFPNSQGFIISLVSGIVCALAAGVLGSVLNKKILVKNLNNSSDPTEIKTTVARLGKGIMILGALNVVGYPLLYLLTPYLDQNGIAGLSVLMSSVLLNVVIGLILLACGMQMLRLKSKNASVYYWIVLIILGLFAFNQLFIQKNIISFDLFMFLAVANFIPRIRKLKTLSDIRTK